ncbi:McrC family protein [Pigmentiphaga aceris]|uniref:McrC family protein n=1 Tax=Pigmentiphaga aceris TaxID=1940612 RepID=UPI001CA30888|nr:McrC family protein [Pigmentiphaga aceris]
MAVGEGGFTRTQANALLAAARGHPSGGREGTRILEDHHKHLTAKQVVGVLAANGCGLEILPKIDPAAPDEDANTIRTRLVHMLDITLGLNLSTGHAAAMARQDETLLDILIRLFADCLLAEVRRGLPRRYAEHRDDLSALRGNMDVLRQFTFHAVRPDRLACRFDALEADTPLMRIMKACVVSLGRHARRMETQRQLAEIRYMLADIPDVPIRSLPWAQVRIDRSNRRWQRLFDLAALFLRRKWQATHHEDKAGEGISLLFPMNDLFEAYIAAQLRKALAGSCIKVVEQGGRRYCLGEWRDDANCSADLFQTKPDIILRGSDDRPFAIIDTKWKKLSADPLDRKHGMSQADVYQMMAYARLYDCKNLVLLYPSLPQQASAVRGVFGIAGGAERLSVTTVDLTAQANIVEDLLLLVDTTCRQLSSDTFRPESMQAA